MFDNPIKFCLRSGELGGSERDQFVYPLHGNTFKKNDGKVSQLKAPLDLVLEYVRFNFQIIFIFYFCFADKTLYNRQLTEERPLEEQVNLFHRLISG